MRRTMLNTGKLVCFLLAVWMLSPLSTLSAQEALRYSSSSQVREAFGEEGLEAFSAATGLPIDLFVTSSREAVRRLMYGYSDLASTTERLHDQHPQYGYKEIPFCRAPIAIITNVQTPVRDITEKQLREIFSREITNWKDLGGPDEPILLIVPDKSTGAYANFQQLAMKRSEVQYDYMAQRSTWVVKAVKRIPWSISFIGVGVATRSEAIRIIKVEGLSPDSPEYPYQEVFSFVLKGEAEGPSKQFIDFVFSEKIKAIMQKNGMTPLDR